jgi:hypothetical protein
MLEQLLTDNKRAILEKWFDLIIDSYPSNTAVFLKRENDRFQNPVGHTFARETEKLFECLTAGAGVDEMAVSVENIVKIRAVQDFTPSQATAVIFLLKQAVRSTLADRLSQLELLHELLDLESRIDRLGLAMFESYMQCREKIYEIRIKEIKNRSSMLFDRMHEHRSTPEFTDETEESNMDIHKKGGDG